MRSQCPEKQGRVHRTLTNNPLNGTDPSGEETYIVSRPVLGGEAMKIAFYAASRAGYVAARARGETVVQAKFSAAIQGLRAAWSGHTFAVVTAPGTDIYDGNIVATYSYGPTNSGTIDPGLTSFRTDSDNPTSNDDARTLSRIISGEAMISDGIQIIEITGVTNEQAMTVFSAPSAERQYFPVPIAMPGTTNSNSEIAARSEALSPGSFNFFSWTPGSEAESRDNVVCDNGGDLAEGC